MYFIEYHQKQNKWQTLVFEIKMNLRKMCREVNDGMQASLQRVQR